MIGALIALGPMILKIIEKVAPDGTNKEGLKAEVEKALLENQRELNSALKDIAVAEIKGNIFQSSWRPMLSYIVIFTFLWEAIVKGILEASLGLDLGGMEPQYLISFCTMWAGVYGLGRSFEKSGSSFKFGRPSDEDEGIIETIRQAPKNWAERQ